MFIEISKVLPRLEESKLFSQTFHVMDYSDIIDIHSPALTLKPLDIVYHSGGVGFRTRCYILYEKVRWPSLNATAPYLFTKHLLEDFFLTTDHYHTALGP